MMNLISVISKTSVESASLISRNNCALCGSNYVLVNKLRRYCDGKNDNKSIKESPLKKLLNDSASFQDAKPQNSEQQWVTLPYAKDANMKPNLEGDFYRLPKTVDPKNTSIILFPGQGAQYVGMAKDLLKFPMARDLFELANYILRYDLLKMCLKGPKNDLDQTKYCQPAVLVCSLAAIERLKEERPEAIDNCVATAGFSLGELTALIFAGAIEFEKGLKLVKIRAEAMQLASEVYKGGMATVLYGPDSKLNYACLKAKEWAKDKGDELPECRIANYLYPHCKVVSGSESALDFLEKNYKEFKLKRVKRLPVSGAFHSDMMAPALEPFRKALRKIDIREPLVRVYSNVDGKSYRDVEHIRKQLPKQIVKPVRWEQLLHTMYDRDPEANFPRTFEVGPGTSLKTILKQVNSKAWDRCHSIQA